MNQKNQEIYDHLLNRLNVELTPLVDKPEETAEGTLRVLWYLANGNARSILRAAEDELPELSQAKCELLEGFVAQRLAGVPLAHLSQRQNFMGLELLAGPEALVPRKETELLVGAAIDKLMHSENKPDSPLIIDVCTGAGNVAVALAANVVSAKVYASDLSAEAVALSQQNVEFLELQDRVETQVSDLLDAFDIPEFHKQVDILTCNPPYISSAKVETMDQEISKYEPHLAFDGGPFGIKILQRLIEEAPRYLKKGGWLAFEVGLGQGKVMMQRVERSKAFQLVECVSDEQSNIRVVLAQI